MNRINLISGALILILQIYGACRGEEKSSLELTESAQTVALSNSLIRLAFSKKNGALESMKRGDQELLAKGGGYVQIAFTSRKDNPKVVWEYKLVRRTAELIEIAFINTGKECPFDFEAHYILRANAPGFYNYLVWGHDVARSPQTIKLAQYNYALRVDAALFTTAAVDDHRISRFPSADLLTPERSVMDSTYKLPNGDYYSKYFFSADLDEKHTVHGAMSDTVGIWIIMPSHEHVNGGPEHQELTVHQAGASQVLLAHATGAHYGAGILTSDEKDGAWRKVSAPWFIYANSAANQSELWQDAKHRASQEVAAWPYAWLDDAAFQLNRGSVFGRISLDDNKPAGGARVILADHEEKPGPLLWQQQWRGYRFYTWADADGRFEIEKVRPGLYDLFSWQPGSFGIFNRQSIKVDAGGKTDLGELIWHRPSDRETVWQIGTPDHSAREFGFAENFRQWGLWRQIAKATPDGVTFVAGKSNDRNWPFEMTVTQKADLSWQVPVWRVQFENSSVRKGKAILSLGIAAYEGKQKPQLEASLNGESIGSIADLEISGAVHRSGVHAGYQEREIKFDAGKLKAGVNILAIEMPAPGKPLDKPTEMPSGGLLWDALRLEIEK